MKEMLASTSLFTEEQINDFIAHGREMNLSKGQSFIREGEIVAKVAFIESGLLRSFYYSSEEEEVTYCFTFPGDWATGYSSYITQQATVENIEAITDVKLLVFSRDYIEQIANEDINWLRYLKMIAEMQYVNMEKRVFQLQKESALTRYKEMLKNNPEYIHLVPLQYLASYLGVSQRHLSRIRKQIVF